MGLLDKIFSSNTEDSEPVLGSSPIEEIKIEQLPDQEQVYASETAEALGYEADSIKTKSQWAALNAQESANLIKEEEEKFYSNALVNASETGSIDEVSKQAQDLAKLKGSYEEIPHAAAISAQKERMAEADLSNPNRFLASDEFKRTEFNKNIKRAILQDWIEQINSKEETTTEKLKMLYSELPLWQAKEYQEAIRSLGIEADEDNYNILTKADAGSYVNQFRNLVLSNMADDTKSPLDFINLLAFINGTWDSVGVNTLRQKSIANNLERFSPGGYTLNALMSLLVAKGLIPKGLKLPKITEETARDLIKVEPKASSTASERLMLFDDAIEMVKGPDGVWRATWEASETFEATADKGVRPTAATSKSDRIVESALAVGDREKAAILLAENYGAPTETTRPIQGSNYKYTIEPLFHPVDPITTNLASSPEITLVDLSNQLNERIQLALKDAGLLAGLKRELSEYHIRKYIDSTNLENSLGVTRPQIIEQLIGTIDQGAVQVGTEGDLFITMKLPNNGMDMSDFGVANARAVEVSKNIEGSSYRLSPTPDGQWEIALQINTHKGWISVYNEYLKDVGDLKRTEFRTTLAGLASVTSRPTALSGTVSALAMESQEYQKIAEIAQKSVKSLKKKEKKTLQAIADAEYFEGAWYSNEYLLERLKMDYPEGSKSPERIVKAHMEIQALNIVDAILRNNAVRRYGVSIGAKEISFNGIRIPGFSRVVEGGLQDMIRVLGNKHLVCIDNLGESFVSAKELAKKTGEVESFFNKGYRLIEINLSPESTVASDYLVYLLNPDALVINDLPTWVTSYVAGPRGIYSHSAGYVKQINSIKSPVTGRNNIVGVKTFMVDEDVVGLQKTVANLNTMLALYKEGRLADLERAWMSNGIALKAKGFKSGRDFIENCLVPMGVNVENIDKFPLEVVKNGVLLDSYKNAIKDPNFEDVAGFEQMNAMHRNSLFQSLNEEAKIKKNRRTGRPLANFNWERAMPLDLEGEIRAQLHRTLTQGSMDDFVDFWSDWFSREFDSVLEKPRGYTPTPFQKLLQIPILDDSKLSDTNKKLAKQAREARKQFNAIRRQPSKVDQYIADKVDTLIRWIDDGVEAIPLTDAMKHGIRLGLNKLYNLPIQHYIRLSATWWHFAGNLSQFLKQGSAVAYITLMDPVNSAPAISNGFKNAMIWKYAGGDRARFLKIVKSYFKGDQDRINCLTNFTGSGLFDTGVVGGLFEKGSGKISKLMEWLMLPFSIGEAYNRLVAYETAERSLGLYGKIITSAAERIRVNRRAQAYFLHMDEAGMSRFQSSQFFQTLSQFQSQRMRFFETAIFDKELTGAQRAKLGLGTAILVGLEGMAGVEPYTWAKANLYVMSHPTDEDRAYAIEHRDEIWRAIERGILNYISEKSGANIDIGKIIAPELGDFGLTLLNLAGLDIPAKGSLGGLFEDLKFAFYALKEGVFGEATSDDLESAFNRMIYSGGLPSGARPFLGYLFYKNGERLNRKGELSERCNSTMQAITYGLGFDSLNAREIQKFYTENAVFSRYYQNVKDEVYKDFMEAAHSKSTRGLDNLLLTLKLSGLSDKDKIKLLTDIQKEAVQKYSFDMIERATMRQLNLQGSRGFGLLQKEIIRRNNEQ